MLKIRHIPNYQSITIYPQTPISNYSLQLNSVVLVNGMNVHSEIIILTSKISLKDNQLLIKIYFK